MEWIARKWLFNSNAAMKYSWRKLMLDALVALPFLVVLGLAFWFARKANLEQRQLDVKTSPADKVSE
jgi:hypothetical protein